MRRNSGQSWPPKGASQLAPLQWARWEDPKEGLGSFAIRNCIVAYCSGDNRVGIWVGSFLPRICGWQPASSELSPPAWLCATQGSALPATSLSISRPLIFLPHSCRQMDGFIPTLSPPPIMERTSFAGSALLVAMPISSRGPPESSAGGGGGSVRPSCSASLEVPWSCLSPSPPPSLPVTTLRWCLQPQCVGLL